MIGFRLNPIVKKKYRELQIDDLSILVPRGQVYNMKKMYDGLKTMAILTGCKWKTNKYRDSVVVHIEKNDESFLLNFIIDYYGVYQYTDIQKAQINKIGMVEFKRLYSNENYYAVVREMVSYL